MFAAAEGSVHHYRDSVERERKHVGISKTLTDHSFNYIQEREKERKEGPD